MFSVAPNEALITGSGSDSVLKESIQTAILTVQLNCSTPLACGSSFACRSAPDSRLCRFSSFVVLVVAFLAFVQRLCKSAQGKLTAGDEARTRDVHLGKVVLYQLSYTRSFERDNNVQPTAPRNLLIASECSKSLNPNRTFAASYDQTLYEKTIPPLHVLARGVWQLVSADSNRSPDCQPDSTDGSDSGNLSSGASINGST